MGRGWWPLVSPDLDLRRVVEARGDGDGDGSGAAPESVYHGCCCCHID